MSRGDRRIRHDPRVRIFHVALESDWQAAKQDGRYAVSTLGRTLAEEGFIHASRADQWQAVRDRFYADVEEPLVLLVIETDRLDAPVVEEAAVPGGTETFPHIYGTLDVAAVANVIPIDDAIGTGVTSSEPAAPTTETHDAGQPQQSMSRLFLEEMMFRLVLATAVIVLAAIVGNVVVRAVGPATGALAALATLAVAGAGAYVLTKRRDRRFRESRS